MKKASIKEKCNKTDNFLHQEKNEAKQPLMQRLQSWFSAGIARSNSACAGTVLLLLPVIIAAILLSVILLALRRINEGVPESDTKTVR